MPCTRNSPKFLTSLYAFEAKIYDTKKDKQGFTPVQMTS